ncbi:MAG: hypothetical protein QME78_03060 [Thermodesulfobacteriota bacterium]|nr:hypothetical protein [Thermodesulfobacteriota bacterium]
MTIAAAYLVSEGVVFGADSSTTISVRTPDGVGDVLQVLSHAQKVFEVGENSRLGVCTWGAGGVGDTSHRTIIARLADEVQGDFSVKDAAEALGSMVEPLVKRAGVDFVGYYLGGWNPKTHEPACFRIEVQQTGTRVEPLTLGLCSFSGNPVFFTRVFRGFDPRLQQSLLEEIKRLLGQDKEPTDFDKIFDQAFKNASDPLVAAGHKDLPIREAIDFVHSYLHITVKAMKFSFGAPVAGGPIEIGFVSTDRRFRWVRHKSFASAILEEEAEYDVR